MVGKPPLLCKRQLPGQTRPHFRLTLAAAGHGSRNLDGFVTGGEDDLLEAAVGSGFDENGGFDHRNGIGAQLSHPILLLLKDEWMDDSVQFRQLRRIAEYNGGQGGAVNAALGILHLGSKRLDDRQHRCAPRLQQSMAHLIGLEDIATQPLQFGGDKAFAGGHAAGETHAQHG